MLIATSLPISASSNVDVGEKVTLLYQEWKNQSVSVQLSSLTKDYIALPAFREIVALGLPAVPHIQNLLDDDFMLAYAVAEICGWERSSFFVDSEQEFRDLISAKLASSQCLSAR